MAADSNCRLMRASKKTGPDFFLGTRRQSRALASPGSRRGWKALPRDSEERGVASKQSREVALLRGASGSCRRGLH